MIGKLFASLFKKRPARPAVATSLDRALLHKVLGRRAPTWRQLKYTGRFLNPREHRLLKIAYVLMIVGFVGWGTLFVGSRVEAVPKDGGEYTEGLVGQPEFINPIFAVANDVDEDITSLIYSGLYRYNAEAKLVPELAASTTVSEDKKKYDISLQPNVVWSDGTPLTADDVVYTFETIQNPEVGSPLFTAFQGVVVEKINDTLVRFTLKEPFAPFVHSLTVGILPKHLWSEIEPSGMRLAKHNIQPIGAGPWMFNKFIKDQSGKIDSYTMIRNERYAGQKPHLKTLRFKFFADYQSAEEALRSGTIQGLAFLPKNDEKSGGKKLVSYSLELPQYTALFFNLSGAEAQKNEEVRQALKIAINKEALIATTFKDRAAVIDSPFLPGMPGFSDMSTSSAFDLNQANVLLDKKWTRIQPEEYFKLEHDVLVKKYAPEIEALRTASTSPEKIAEREQEIEQLVIDDVRRRMPPEQTFYRKDKDNQILTLTITTVDAAEYVAVAEAIRLSWMAAGVQTLVRTAGASEMRDILKNRSYQALLYGEILGGDPDPFPFWHSSQATPPGLNLSGFADRNADKLLEDARLATDENKRAELHRSFQGILTTKTPAIFLFRPLHIYSIDIAIHGVGIKTIAAPANRFSDVPNWYVKTKWKWKQ